MDQSTRRYQGKALESPSLKGVSKDKESIWWMQFRHSEEYKCTPLTQRLSQNKLFIYVYS